MGKVQYKHKLIYGVLIIGIILTSIIILFITTKIVNKNDEPLLDTTENTLINLEDLNETAVLEEQKLTPIENSEKKYSNEELEIINGEEFISFSVGTLTAEEVEEKLHEKLPQYTFHAVCTDTEKAKKQWKKKEKKYLISCLIIEDDTAWYVYAN